MPLALVALLLAAPVTKAFAVATNGRSLRVASLSRSTFPSHVIGESAAEASLQQPFAGTVARGMAAAATLTSAVVITTPAMRECVTTPTLIESAWPAAAIISLLLAWRSDKAASRSNRDGKLGILGAISFCESMVIAAVCARFLDMGLGEVLLQAATLTGIDLGLRQARC